jgi:hypothetical protein
MMMWLMSGPYEAGLLIVMLLELPEANSSSIGML